MSRIFKPPRQVVRRFLRRGEKFDCGPELIEQVMRPNGELIGTLHYERGSGMLVGRWLAYHTPENVILGLSHLLRMMEKRPCAALLSDGSAATGDWSEALAWVQYDFLPRLVARGARFVAVVRSTSPNARQALEQWVQRAARYMAVRSFDDPKAARQWLRAQLRERR